MQSSIVRFEHGFALGTGCNSVSQCNENSFAVLYEKPLRLLVSTYGTWVLFGLFFIFFNSYR